MSYKLPDPNTFDKLFAQINNQTIQKIETNFWKNVAKEKNQPPKQQLFQSVTNLPTVLK